MLQSISFSVGQKPTELHGISEKSKEIALKPQITGGEGRTIDANMWLPRAAEAYHISPKLSDYILIPVPSLISDISNTNGDSVSKAELLRFQPDHGCLAYQTWKGKPTHCFPADTPIKTEFGLRKIQNIKEGDSVLTHKNRYRKVVKTFDNGTQWLSEIICQGLPENILTTDNHPFWVIDQRQFFNKTNDKKNKGFKDKPWSELKPHFREVTDIYPGDYLCAPICIGGDISVDKDFAFLTGLHMAEGSYLWKNKEVRKTKSGKPSSVFLTLGRVETELREYTLNILEKLQLKYKIYWHRINNTCSIWIRDSDFAGTMYDLTGEYSHKKRMKGELRKWNRESLSWFLGGYISGDGCIKYQSKHALVRCRTSSEFLAVDIWHTMARLGVVARANKDRKPNYKEYFCPKYNVMRSVSSNHSYIIAAADWSAYVLNKYIVGKMKMKPLPREKTHLRVIVKDDYILCPVKRIKHKVSRRKVYNFEVEEDNSYVAGGVVVHNCEHQNKDITKAKGIILDVFLRPMARYTGNHVKVIKLLAFDRTKDEILCKNILDRKVNTYSLGMWFKSYTCTICNNRVGQNFGTMCVHTKPRKPIYQQLDGKLCYRQCENIIGFETSVVQDPAYVIANSDHIMDVTAYI